MTENSVVISGWVVLIAVVVSCVGFFGLTPLIREFPEFWRTHVAAETRSHQMLRDLLSPEEYQQVIRHGYLDVASPTIAQRIYRIPHAEGLVKVYERGAIIMELCLRPVDPLPASDLVVLHKLMIISNEPEYLAQANRFAPYFFV